MDLISLLKVAAREVQTPVVKEELEKVINSSKKLVSFEEGVWSSLFDPEEDFIELSRNLDELVNDPCFPEPIELLTFYQIGTTTAWPENFKNEVNSRVESK